MSVGIGCVRLRPALLAGLLSSLLTGFCLAGWDIQVVDNAPDVGRHNSLAFDLAGRPVISYYDQDSDALRCARWNGSAWGIEVVDGSAGGLRDDTSLAFDHAGNPAVSYCGNNCQELRLARWTTPVIVHRSSVPSLLPGWKSAALPLTSANDDEIPPFPVSTVMPGLVEDSTGGEDPVVIYRVLAPGDVPTGNSLLSVKRPAGTELSF